MSQEVAVESGGTGNEQSVTEYDSSDRDNSSHLAERFGMGIAGGILVGAVIGVVLTWVLGTDSVVAWMIALGIGFILSPVLGVLVAERGE